MLDANERAVGKKVLAEEFFRKHEDDLHIFGPQIANNSRKKNVENLVNSYRYVQILFFGLLFCIFYIKFSLLPTPFNRACVFNLLYWIVST